MSKYDPLWKYIKEKQKDNYELTYEEIYNILGFEIDHSFLTYKKELLEFGYEVKKYLSGKRKSFLVNIICRGSAVMNEYINLTLENIDNEYICCAIDDKKHQAGVDIKKEWIKSKFRDGHVFRKLNTKDKIFIVCG